MARPAEFDRNEVLNQAMEVFWRTGYTATSVTDLVNATQLNPGSLYGAFNSKRGLFLEVIDNYANNSLTRVNECMKSDSSIESINHFFLRLCQDMQCDKMGKGCLMVNTMLELAAEDDGIRIKITEYFSQIEHCFYISLENSRLKGEIKADTDCDSLAKMLMTAIWGLRVMSTTRPDPQIYSGILQHLLFSVSSAKA